jgi:hypothetical protein
LMSGDGKRGDGQRPQATAPILDSTEPDIDPGRTVPETVLTSGLAQSWEGTVRRRCWLCSDLACAHGAAEGSRRIEQHGRCERYARAWCSDDAHGATFGSNALLAFRVSPMAGLKNCYARLQEGKVIAMGN